MYTNLVVLPIAVTIRTLTWRLMWPHTWLQYCEYSSMTTASRSQMVIVAKDRKTNSTMWNTHTRSVSARYQPCCMLVITLQDSASSLFWDGPRTEYFTYQSEPPMFQQSIPSGHTSHTNSLATETKSQPEAKEHPDLDWKSSSCKLYFARNFSSCIAHTG